MTINPREQVKVNVTCFSLEFEVTVKATFRGLYHQNELELG